MNVALGFGASEQEEARKIIQACFDEDMRAVQERYRAQAEVYKTAADPPERYTYFFCVGSCPYEGKVIREFTMHHINRKHPMSPDGWALFVTRWVSIEDTTAGLEERTIYREA